MDAKREPPHERLVDAWKRQAHLLANNELWVAHSKVDDSGEDLMNAAYMREGLPAFMAEAATVLKETGVIRAEPDLGALLDARHVA